MKKEQEKKVLTCLYIIIGILILNTICHFITLSKIDNSTNFNNANETTSNDTSSNDYDISKFNSLKPAEVTKKVKAGEQIVLYIGREGCTYCRQFIPILQQAQENFKYTTIYLDIDNVNTNSTDYKELAALMDVQKTANGETKKFGEFQVTPMVAVFNKGKMVDGMIGYNTYNNFVSFLESAGFSK